MSNKQTWTITILYLVLVLSIVFSTIAVHNLGPNTHYKRGWSKGYDIGHASGKEVWLGVLELCEQELNQVKQQINEPQER